MNALVDGAAGLLNVAIVVASIVLAAAVAVGVWQSRRSTDAATAGWAAGSALLVLLVMLTIVRPWLVDQAREPVKPAYQPPTRNTPWDY